MLFYNTHNRQNTMKMNIIPKHITHTSKPANLFINDYNHYKKINFVDKILWINLKRSTERRKYMETVLLNIDIPNERVEAFDGKHNIIDHIKNKDYRSTTNDNTTNKVTNYEIACTLSHLKAINQLKATIGDYFLILEDDVVFDNVKFIPCNLQKIIQDSPPFDILQLHKHYLSDIFKTDYKRFTMNDWTTGTAAYVISRSGINKITKLFDFQNNILQTNLSNICEADKLIYTSCNTYTYKYNIISTLGNNSTIHPSHVTTQLKCNKFQDSLIVKYLDHR